MPTVLLVVSLLVIGIPLVVWLIPDQRARVVGQDVAVGAQDPSLTLSGPARIVQTGNTAFDVRAVQVVGPLRPQLSLGPIRRDRVPAGALDPAELPKTESAAVRTLVGAFLRWYAVATAGVVAVALAASGAVGCLRVLVRLRREGRSGDGHTPVGELAAKASGEIARMTLVATAVTLVAWAACGVAAYRGTVDGLAGVGSLTDLVGATSVTPAPVGPPVYGYAGAVIGDSRVARLGGPPPPHPSPDDTACGRSADSTAAELAQLRRTRVLNLACSGASITAGLRGPQQIGGRTVPAQIGRLRQVEDLDWVVVAIGPNDLKWADFLGYCYVVTTCDDALTAGEFDRRLTDFDHQYAALLADLSALPGSPRVVVMASYDAFPVDPDPACPDLHGPPGTPGLDGPAVALLNERNGKLNDVLRSGARQYGFPVVQPPLTPLCAAGGDGLGPDLQSLGDPDPFHPTAVGSLRLAAALATAVAPPSSAAGSSAG